MIKNQLLKCTIVYVLVLFVQNSVAQDPAQWHLPEGAKVRLGRGYVTDIQYSPDGTQLAVASTIGIWLYNTSFYRPMDLLAGPMHGTYTVAFSPDGNIIAGGGRDYAIHLWDAKNGKHKQILTGHTDTVSSIAFSPDGKTIVSASADRTIRLWNAKTGRHRSVFYKSTRFSNVAFSPDGKTIAATSGGYIHLWNAHSGRPKNTIGYSRSGTRSTAFSPDGKIIAGGGRDYAIHLWDAKNGKQKQTLTRHTYWIAWIAFSPDGKTIASASADKTIRLWDAKTGKHKLKLTGHWNWVNKVVFSPDGKTIASASSDETIRIWDTKTGKHKQTLTGHKGQFRNPAISPDGKTIVTSSDKTIHLWNARTGRHKRLLVRDNKGFNDIAISPDGKTIATGLDTTIRLWDAKNGKNKLTFTGHTRWIKSIVFSPDGNTIASASYDETIRLWDAKNGKQKLRITTHTRFIDNIVFSPDGSTIAMSSDATNSDGTIYLWDAKNGKQKQILAGHTGSVESIVFSPDGSTIASASRDTTIRLWDAKNGKQKQILTGHTSSVESIAFSPDGNTIASVSRDTTIRLWDAKNGKQQQILTQYTDIFWNVTFSPDGKTIATGGSTVLLWDLEFSIEAPTSLSTQRPVTFTSSSQDTTQWNLPDSAKARIGKGKANDIAVSPNGAQLAVATSIGIWIYNANNGTEIALLTGYTSPVNAIAYSPDGSTFAGVSNNELHLWNTRNLQHRSSLALGGRLLAYAPNSGTLAVESKGSLSILNTRTSQIMLSVPSKSEEIDSIAFSPDSRTIAYSISDSYPKSVVGIYLLNARNGQIQQELAVSGAHPIRFLSFSSDGRELRGIRGLRSVDTRELYKWNLSSESKELTVSWLPKGESYASSSDGSAIAAGRFGHIKLRYFPHDRTRPSLILVPVDCYSDVGEQGSLSVFNIDFIAFSSDGSTLAGASENGIYLWNARTGVHKLTISQHLDIKSVAYSPDNNTLATLSHGGIHLWDSQNGQYNRKLVGFCRAYRIKGLAYSPDGSKLAFSSGYGWTNLLDARTGTHVQDLSNSDYASIEEQWGKKSPQYVNVWSVLARKIMSTVTRPTEFENLTFGISPNGNIGVIGRSDGSIELLKNDKRHTVLGHHSGNVTAIAFSPNGNTFASGSDDSRIQLWSTSVVLPRGVFEGHTTGFSSLAFSPDGNTLASGSPDGTILLWNVQSKTVEQTFDGHTMDVTDLAFSPHGSTLTSRSLDGEVLLWDLAPSQQIYIPASRRPPIYWMDAEDGTLHRLIGNEVANLAPSVQNATSLAVDMAGGKIYWVTGRSSRMHRANLDGTRVEQLFNLLDVPILDIVVDPVSNNLCWTDTLGRIWYFDLNKRRGRNVVSDLKSPKDIALDVSGGKLYWITKSDENKSTIYRANLDRNTNVEKLADVNGVPLDIAVEPDTGWLYWADSLGRIRRANRNGKQIRNVVGNIEGLENITLDVADGKIYWTEKDSLRRANRNGGNIQDLATGLGTPVNIVLGIMPVGSGTSAAPEITVVPDQTLILSNYPNPFNPETWIPYQLAKPSDVKITIYDTRGVVVRKLELGHQPPGFYTDRSRAAYWDGRNALGERVASGIYFYQFEAESVSLTRKMLILK